MLKEVKYLGHIISEEGIKPDPQKIECINSYPIPRCVKDVRAFLGLAGWYRKFIKNFSQVALPLTNLTKKSEKFEITPGVIEAMNVLKRALTSESILIYPDFDQPFILATDSSDFGTGSILSQLRNGFEKPIAFASRKFNKAERNYSVSEKECLGIVAGIKAHKWFLYGKKFTIVTDHRPLKWLLNLKDPTSRLARWALLLSEYDFDIAHRPGRKHGNVDALSRIYNVQLETNFNNVDSVIKYVNEINYVNPYVQEVKGDLFNCPEYFSLAHCVSQDFYMSQGIAKTFKNYFRCVNELIAQNKNLGEVAELILTERNIYYMITKTKYYNKPSYQNVFVALNNLKESCQLHCVTYLGMPRIACGLDKLNWEIVCKLINFVFKDTNVKIYIYTKEMDQNGTKLNVLKVDIIDEPLCIPVWDRDNIKQEQYKDNFCKEIIDYLNGPGNEFYLDYFLDNEKILYKLGENGNSDRLVLPKNYINKTLHDFHCLPFAGHQGQQKTIDLIKSLFKMEGNECASVSAESCGFCKKSAVNKKVKCANCSTVFHTSCYKKNKNKKCCDKPNYFIENQPEIIMEGEIEETLNDPLIEQSTSWENKFLKDMNKELRENNRLLKEKIEELKIENAHLKNSHNEIQKCLDQDKHAMMNNVIGQLTSLFENIFTTLTRGNK